MSRVTARERRRRRGFTLIEVLVALAVVAAALAAIGGVVAANARATRTVEARVALEQTARAVLAGLPPRRDLAAGGLDGELAGHRWRTEVRPLASDGVPAGSPWEAKDVIVTVRGPSGATLVLETVRLTRRPTE
ncbi:prepilin-type N-terminal cleavage/methylation domain-containing protein [Rhodoplanes sp. TEM]|uniref:Prepilin-type N-terminal cleavage/methylation domain-containing protein n=1 Tax=Rhodoplanes tepidamans TaxID=200616 RepID=A0ABT5JC74_RHOTP|nr:MULTISPECIES: prepilin-type N-terminal cleavage/methylation domain-containing protein [Rhodoplanes]MDC7787290.1 prepilin-type N-terminal cleavage/methylation domain-containing protein [Rhodoplanes tepidamans]MDC7985318.1 prepilin-type N-terminal cleavage/methylation domain-containing protein [Rhodoplanes sp. TEM]MDQ0357825.1 general secretion pathway protein I [Rhodoplanes tepidamans]